MRVLGQKSKIDIDLLYPQIYINSLRRLRMPIFRPKSLIFSLTSYVPAFSNISPCDKKERLTKVHHLYDLEEFEYPVTHTKFQGKRRIGSGGEDF